MVKQVIVIRKDLGMGKGKIAAQAAHASINVLLDKGHKNFDYPYPYVDITLTDAMKEWIKSGMTKVVVGVDSEQELLDIYEAAKGNNIPTSLIKDAAKTQLDQPEYTAVAVGPAGDRKIDKIVGGLKLL